MKTVFLKPLCDVAMLTLFLLLMADKHMGNTVHEWLGVVLFAVFCLHTWLNWRWYTLLFRGRYSLRRCILLILNLLLLCAFCGTVTSAVFLSKTIFAFLALKGEIFARTLHMCCAHWSLILASFHLGLYWKVFWASCRRILGLQIFPVSKALMLCLSLLIVFHGITVFFQRNLLDTITLRSAFMFWTEQDSLWKTLYDYAAIFFTGTLLAHIFFTGKKRVEHNA